MILRLVWTYLAVGAVVSAAFMVEVRAFKRDPHRPPLWKVFLGGALLWPLVAFVWAAVIRHDWKRRW